jgi:hypothetical protein
MRGSRSGPRDSPAGLCSALAASLVEGDAVAVDTGFRGCVGGPAESASPTTRRGRQWSAASGGGAEVMVHKLLPRHVWTGKTLYIPRGRPDMASWQPATARLWQRTTTAGRGAALELAAGRRAYNVRRVVLVLDRGGVCTARTSPCGRRCWQVAACQQPALHATVCAGGRSTTTPAT